MYVRELLPNHLLLVGVLILVRAVHAVIHLMIVTVRVVLHPVGVQYQQVLAVLLAITVEVQHLIVDIHRRVAAAAVLLIATPQVVLLPAQVAILAVVAAVLVLVVILAVAVEALDQVHHQVVAEVAEDN